MSISRKAREFKKKLNRKSSKKLIRIWVENDREKWPFEAFEAIRMILDERGEGLPLQNSTTYQSWFQTTSPPQIKRVKKLTGIRGWFHSLLHKYGII